MAQPSVARSYFEAHLHDVTDACMVWPYSTNSGGYGQVWIGGRNRKVHQLACEAHHGPRPAQGLEAAHGPCHNPACWNGAHVSWKTPVENQSDRERDGTKMSGETHYAAKITEVDVREIRARYPKGGVSYSDLGRQYGVAKETIANIVKCRTWAQVGPD